VDAYPRKTPKAVIGISILAIRLLILNNRYKSIVTPNTQPTWGRALKAIIIEAINPQDVSSEIFSLSCKIRNKEPNAEITQNSVALSLSPKIDHRKWLGMKIKIENRPKKILGLFSVNCTNFGCLDAILRIINTSKQTSNKP
jgi:hypothetical protein